MKGFTTLKTAFESDAVALGGDARTFSPTVIELFGSLGLDYAWLDYEHSGPNPADTHHVEQLCRAAAAADIEPVIRLPTGDSDLVSKVLDTGVRSIVVPQVETADEVRRIVSAARFPTPSFDGDRGIGLVRTNDWGGELDDYVRRENESINIGVMIENQQAVDSIREIVSVDGLGFVFIGPADLSLSIEQAFEPDAAAVTDAIATVITEADAADIPVGRSVGSVDAADEAINQGYRMLSVGRDLQAIRSALEPRIEALR